MPAPRERYFTKSKTFAATAGNGAQGTVTVITVTGAVHIDRLNVRCTTTMTGGSATVALGVSGLTTSIIGTTTATGITAGLSWLSTSPGLHQTGIVNRVVDSDLIITVATADVTGGVLEFEIYYHPMSSDGLLS